MVDVEHIAKYKVGPAAYTRGCRCSPCTQANTRRCSQYQAQPRVREYKARWQRNRAKAKAAR